MGNYETVSHRAFEPLHRKGTNKSSRSRKCRDSVEQRGGYSGIIRFMIERIHWLGHASFRINGPPHKDGSIIYIDPWRLPADSPPADIILVSHDHHDHCSPQDIASIRREHTVVVSNTRAAEIIGPG